MTRSIRGTRLALLGWPLLLQPVVWAGGVCDSQGGPATVGVEYVSTECPANPGAPILYRRVNIECVGGQLQQSGPGDDQTLPPTVLADAATVRQHGARHGVVNFLGTQALFVSNAFAGSFRLDASGQARTDALPLSSAGRCAGATGAGEAPSLDNPGCQSQACLDSVAGGMPSVNPGWRGNLFLVENDYRAGGATPLRFSRYYNSQPLILPFDSAALGRNVGLQDFDYSPLPYAADSVQYYAPEMSEANRIARGELGGGWRGSLSRRLVMGQLDGEQAVAVLRDDGKSYLYRRDAAGVLPWRGPVPTVGRLEELPGQGWRFIADDGEIETYGPNGALQSVSYPNGQRHQLEYDGGGRLLTVRNDGGGILRFAYLDGRLSRLQDNISPSTEYSWDKGRLRQVTAPLKAPVEYQYQLGTLPLLRMVRTPGNSMPPRAEYLYDAQGRIQEGRFNALPAFQIDYAAGPNAPTLRSADGTLTRFNYQPDPVLRRLASVSIQCSPVAVDCVNTQTDFRYDPRGLLIEENSPGRDIRYQYDPVYGLETDRFESGPNGAGIGVHTNWVFALRKPASRHAANRNSEFGYDSLGRLMQRTEWDNGVEQSWRYQRDGEGRTRSVEASGGVSSYAYDAAGNLLEVRSPQGQQQLSRDPSGRVRQVQSPDGPREFEYDPQGRLRAYRHGSLSLMLDYDPQGRLFGASSASGSLNYLYDGLGQLQEVRGASGAYVRYLYEQSPVTGLRVREQAFDPSGEIGTMLGQVRAALEINPEPALPL